MAVQCGIRDARKQKTSDEIIPRNKKLREFYDKKREEGKSFRVAIIAYANKLLHWIGSGAKIFKQLSLTFKLLIY